METAREWEGTGSTEERWRKEGWQGRMGKRGKGRMKGRVEGKGRQAAMEGWAGTKWHGNQCV